jgi:hypothetical protein
MTRAAFLGLLVSAACIPENGPTMSPGEDCLSCHDGGDAPRWTVAGTVYQAPDADVNDGVRGVAIHLRDADGRAITIRSNDAGNFFTAERLRFPLTVAVEKAGERHEMPEPVEYGGCNRCHTLPPQEGAPGRVSITGGHDHDAEAE